MHRHGFGTVVIITLIAAACSQRPTSPTAPPQVTLPQRVELVRGQSVTVPGTSLQLTLQTAPLWMVPSCPFGREAINCVPEGPGVLVDAQVPGRRESFDLMRNTRPTRTFDRYQIRLEAIDPEPPLYTPPAPSGYAVRLLITSAIVAP